VSGVAKGVVLQGVDPPAQLVEWAQDFERMGFDHLWMTDSSLHARDPYQMLALAAAATHRITLGTAVTNPVTRHPALTAVSSATLDEASGGRAILGIGAGDRPLVALGLEPARLSALEQSIGAIRALHRGEHLDLDADRFSFHDAHLRIPARSDIPVFISASGPKTLQLSGRIADGVILLCGLDPGVVGWAIDQIASGAATADRSMPHIAVFAYGIIDEDEDAALAGARSIAAWFPQTAPHYCDLVGLDPDIRDAVRERYAGGEFQEADAAAALLPADFVRKMALSGNRDRTTAQLRALADAGVDSINVFPLGNDRRATIDAFDECFVAAGI